MLTTAEARAILRAHADDDTQWAMGREVKNSLSDLLDDVEELQAESAATEKWMHETWPTIEDRLVRERNEALEKVAALTEERDRPTRARDENEAIANRALAMGLRCADLARLAGLTVGFSIDFECCQPNTRD